MQKCSLCPVMKACKIAELNLANSLKKITNLNIKLKIKTCVFCYIFYTRCYFCERAMNKKQAMNLKELFKAAHNSENAIKFSQEHKILPEVKLC